MRILHITAWYPSDESPFEAMWIKRLIQSMPSDCEQTVYHAVVKPGRRFKLKSWRNEGVKHTIVELPVKTWIVIEIVNFCLLCYYLIFRRIQANHDVINFHIAYPQLVFWSVLRPFVKRPIVVSEHWSAYHFNFGVKRELPRIKQIFNQRFSLITVSNSLRNDIERFAGLQVFKAYILPNVVDTAEFTKQPGVLTDNRSFFMLSQWKSPKRPEVIFEAFSELIKIERFKNYSLRVGGYGDQLHGMKAMVKSLDLESNVQFLGTLLPPSIVAEMNKASAFLHCSDYETFSVVCAEAVCCGSPVIASAVGGIPEIIDDRNGVLVKNNTLTEWLAALKSFDHARFDRDSICLAANERFSSERIGLCYADILKDISHAG